MKRYLIFAEGYSHDPHWGKTGRGVIDYSPHPTVAILDSRRAGETYAGVPIVGSLTEALTHEPTTALVGIALPAGVLPEDWRTLVRAALEAGVDVEAGTHRFLGDDPELARAAAASGATIRDLRRPPADLEIASGAAYRSRAAVALAVGSDCASGKKTVMLELDRAARARGVASAFVPTGQTGVAIAGWGLALDAVVSDFLAGGAERLVLEGARRADVLFVEGQGSLLHPQFSGVTLGLYHGSAPHVLVLSHIAGRSRIAAVPDHPIPPLPQLIALYESIALPLRPATVAAISLNTGGLDRAEARAAVAAVERETGLTTDDPVRFGCDRLLDAVLSALPTV